MTTFAHISDSHLGAGGDEVDNCKSLVADLIERRPDFVLHSGDVTDNGAPAEYANAEVEFGKLDRAGIPGLFVPGNHDCGWKGITWSDLSYEQFHLFRERTFKTPRGFPYVMTCDDGVRFICLDSCEATSGDRASLAKGEIGYLQAMRLAKYLDDDYFSVVMLHHHPFDRGFGLELVDSEHILYMLAERCDLLLFGHRHSWDAWSESYGIDKLFAADKTTQPHEGALRYRMFEATKADGLVSYETITVHV